MFGNAPAVKQPEWAEGIVDVVNMPSRVYSRWVNGNENFFYRGNAQALAEMLRKYSAVKDEVRQLILLPGSGQTQSFKHQPIDFNWQLHVPSGIYRAVSKRKHAVMTVYVGARRPRSLAKKDVEKWLQELSSEAFKTRETAAQQLQKLGTDAKPFLRAALKAPLALETRRRIDGLLERLRELDVSDIEIPKGITVLSVEDLVEAGLKHLEDSDATVRGLAIQDLSGLAIYSDKVVPALVRVFKTDKNEHVHRVAAACLASVEVQARAAVPTLKQGLTDPDAYVRSACQTALDRLGDAMSTPEVTERTRRDLEILQEINEFIKTIGAKN
jgi:hypothetical protein